MRIVIATDRTVGLAEGIIDGTKCLLVYWKKNEKSHLLSAVSELSLFIQIQKWLWTVMSLIPTLGQILETLEHAWVIF